MHSFIQYYIMINYEARGTTRMITQSQRYFESHHKTRNKDTRRHLEKNNGMVYLNTKKNIICKVTTLLRKKISRTTTEGR
jgi:hypothetical protein